MVHKILKNSQSGLSHEHLLGDHDLDGILNSTVFSPKRCKWSRISALLH